MNLAESYLGREMLEHGVKLLVHTPEGDLGRLARWGERIAIEPAHKRMAAGVRRFLEDKESNWYQLAHRLLTETHPTVRERMAIDFFVNACLLGVPRQKAMAKVVGASVPWAILMDPTERCNLRCRGCWAGEYQRQRELDLETMDRICTEGEELGIYFYVISGGEPMVRKDDLLELARRHPDQVFHLFTNGTLITPEFARKAAELGNMTFALSVEGLEATTDQRRGKGTFQKVLHAMDTLREAGLIYGISVTYTRLNTEELGSDAFIDLMIDKGASFAWFFTYIPIGKDVDLEYMATPEQRAYMFDRIQAFRRTKPIFLMDFWNDGEAAHGCIAGGRRYFHINANGDVEPCAFVHYATCNIKEVSLKEALQNPLFKAYQARQPFDQNHRRPCPLIDHPDQIQAMVHEAQAYPTQLDPDETVDEFAAKMAGYASAWGMKADGIWAEQHPDAAMAARD